MTVTAAIDERIRELVVQHEAELAQLVDAELERVLGELVEQRLAARNGATETSRRRDLLGEELETPEPGPALATPAPTTDPDAATVTRAELCSSCGERPRQPGRTLCRTCRTTRDRERKAAQAAHVGTSDDDPPRPDPEPATTARERGGARGRIETPRVGQLARTTTEAWLVEHGFARREGDELVATDAAREVAWALAPLGA